MAEKPTLGPDTPEMQRFEAQLVRLMVASSHPKRLDVLYTLVQGKTLPPEATYAILRNRPSGEPGTVDLLERALHSDDSTTQAEAIAASLRRPGVMAERSEAYLRSALTDAQRLPATIIRALIDLEPEFRSPVVDEAMRTALTDPDPAAAVPVAVFLLHLDSDNGEAWRVLQQYAPAHNLSSYLIGTTLLMKPTLRERIDQHVVRAWPDRPLTSPYALRRRAVLAHQASQRLGRPRAPLAIPPRMAAVTKHNWPFRFYGADGTSNENRDEFQVVIRFCSSIAEDERADFSRTSGICDAPQWFANGRIAVVDAYDAAYDVGRALVRAHQRFPILEAMNTSIRDLACVEDAWSAWSMWINPQPAALPAEVAATVHVDTLWFMSDWPAPP